MALATNNPKVSPWEIRTVVDDILRLLEAFGCFGLAVGFRWLLMG